MIKAGQLRKAKYWGEYHINKVVELPSPEIFDTSRWGRTCFRPTIAEIQWENGKKDSGFRTGLGQKVRKGSGNMPL